MSLFKRFRRNKTKTKDLSDQGKKELEYYLLKQQVKQRWKDDFKNNWD